MEKLGDLEQENLRRVQSRFDANLAAGVQGDLLAMCVRLTLSPLPRPRVVE